MEELDKIINETTDWKNASDITVKRAIRNIKDWKKEMNRIMEKKREFLIVVEKNKFTEEEDGVSTVKVKGDVEDLKADMDAAVLSIENEDNIRALYTLDITPITDPVKLPKFSGKEGEDYQLFKEEIQRGFVQNRTPKADQLLKLRECLSGAALTLVPKSTVTTIDEAWAVLKKSYGDAYRVIKYRKEELMKVGKMPKINEKMKGGYNQQIAWFLKIESLITGILDLGKNHPEYGEAAFSLEFICDIIMMFPQRVTQKLSQCSGQKEVRLKNILSKIEAMREEAQNLQLIMDVSSSRSATGGGGSNGSGAGAQQHSQVSGDGGYGVVRGLLAYKPPRRDENCRICNMLETEGDTDNLYDDHIHNFPTGCPRYIMMTMKQRAEVSRKAKLCLNCHDPEYTFRAFDKNHFCGKGKKSRYTCRNAACKKHMWICEKHKDENEEALEKFKDEYQRNHKLLLGLFTTQLQTPAQSPDKKSKVPEGTKNIIEACEKSKPSILEISEEEEKTENSKSPPTYKNISTKAATKMLKRKISSSGENVEVRPIPKGRAQFMIGQTKG